MYIYRYTFYNCYEWPANPRAEVIPGVSAVDLKSQSFKEGHEKDPFPRQTSANSTRDDIGCWTFHRDDIIMI
jgi:hypothetical protein